MGKQPPSQCFNETAAVQNKQGQDTFCEDDSDKTTVLIPLLSTLTVSILLTLSNFLMAFWRSEAAPWRSVVKTAIFWNEIKKFKMTLDQTKFGHFDT